jgi:hypothetical protein
MFVGHLAIGLVAKRIESRVSLGTWVLAASLADLLAFPLLILGVEHFDVEPGTTANRFVGRNIAYSHSLMTIAAYAALFAVVYFLCRRYRHGALLLSCVVLTHWFLDVVSHRPDMPLAPGVSAVFGFGLWNSLPATLLLEGGFWLLSVILYLRTTHAKSIAAHFVFWIGVVLLTLLWYGNVVAGMEPNPIKAGVGGLVIFSLVVAWAYSMNRLRADRIARPYLPSY